MGGRYLVSQRCTCHRQVGVVGDQLLMLVFDL